MNLIDEAGGPNEKHDHSHSGLATDLKYIMARRRALKLLGGGSSFALLTACAGGGSGSGSSTSTPSSSSTSTPTPTPTPTPTSTSTATAGECVAHPTETNGPYPADGSNNANGAVANVLIESGIVRSDIRSSFNGSTGTADGVDMTLTITLSNVNDSCAALAGYAIYVWHCTAEGEYSIYNISNENYLRGVGVTDTNGQVTFQTIVPGCYAGRFPHIHFEVYEDLSSATHYNNRLLVSQMAVPEDEAAFVYSTESTTYGDSSRNLSQISISSDNVFGDNTNAQIEAQTLVMTGSIQEGYEASVTVGLAV